MTLQSWLANGWVRKQATSQEEVRDLLRIVDRDLVDATSDLSSDWKFGIAYNAALKLCTVVLRASGYRAERACSIIERSRRCRLSWEMIEKGMLTTSTPAGSNATRLSMTGSASSVTGKRKS